MRFAVQGVYTDGSGKIVVGGTATLYEYNSSAPSVPVTTATAYDAVTGGSLISGAAVTTDTNGGYILWVDDANYDGEDTFTLILSKSTHKDVPFHFSVPGLPTGIVQVVNVISSAVATGVTAMPNDDTIPQNDEGDEYMTLAITPRRTTNNLLINVSLVLSNSNASMNLIAALFQDSTVSALAVGCHAQSDAGFLTNVNFSYKMAAGTTSATTFKVRAGAPTGATTTFNGSAGGRFFGGVISSSITITEYI